MTVWEAHFGHKIGTKTDAELTALMDMLRPGTTLHMAGREEQARRRYRQVWQGLGILYNRRPRGVRPYK